MLPSGAALLLCGIKKGSVNRGRKDLRRAFLKLVAGAAVTAASRTPAQARKRFAPLAADVTSLVPFKASPFPFHGENPETHEPFLNVHDGARLGHQTARAGIRWEDETYSDRRTLLSLPAGFDLEKPAAIAVYFHGNDCTLERDVLARQHVPAQLAQSGINAVLAAPQFALDARDSSPGNFWRAGYFARWLAEAAAELASLHGQGAKAANFARLPVLLVAYSGGYFPAAWVLKQGGANRRIAGVILFDALYGDTEKFADWAAANHRRAFLFSAVGKTTRPFNQMLQHELQERGIIFARDFPKSLRPGQLYFGDVPDAVNHVEFLSSAWTDDPLRWTLARIPAFARK